MVEILVGKMGGEVGRGRTGDRDRLEEKKRFWGKKCGGIINSRMQVEVFCTVLLAQWSEHRSYDVDA